MECLGVGCMLLIPVFFVGVLVMLPVLAHLLRRRPSVPVVPIGQAAVGQRVGLVGQVIACEHVRAYLSDADAVVAEVEVAQRHRKRFRRVFQHRDAVPFLLDDGTGRAELDPRGAPIAWTGVDVHGESKTFDGPNPRERALLERFEVQPQNELGLWRWFRYQEWAIFPGDRLHVEGTVASISPDGVRVLAADGLVIFELG